MKIIKKGMHGFKWDFKNHDFWKRLGVYIFSGGLKVKSEAKKAIWSLVRMLYDRQHGTSLTGEWYRSARYAYCSTLGSAMIDYIFPLLIERTQDVHITLHHPTPRLRLQCNPGHESGQCRQKLSRSVANRYSLPSIWQMYPQIRIDGGHMLEAEFTRLGKKDVPRIKVLGTNELKIDEENKLPRSELMTAPFELL